MKQLSLHDSTWMTLWKRQNELYSDRKQIRGHLAGDREGTCLGVVDMFFILCWVLVPRVFDNCQNSSLRTSKGCPHSLYVN